MYPVLSFPLLLPSNQLLKAEEISQLLPLLNNVIFSHLSASPVLKTTNLINYILIPITLNFFLNVFTYHEYIHKTLNIYQLMH